MFPQSNEITDHAKLMRTVFKLHDRVATSLQNNLRI